MLAARGDHRKMNGQTTLARYPNTIAHLACGYIWCTGGHTVYAAGEARWCQVSERRRCSLQRRRTERKARVGSGYRCAQLTHQQQRCTNAVSNLPVQVVSRM
jgi:hypothetical protein